MDTTTTEIADNIFRISTLVSEAGMSFNQFLIKDDEPLLFHTGMRALVPLVSRAVEAVLPVSSLRWIGFGHVEADECGALSQWLEAAPNARVAFGALGCMVSVNDLADRPPHPLEDGDVIDLGERRVRYLATPHVPHGWEAGLTPSAASIIERLADLEPKMLALMHGPAYSGDGGRWLRDLAADQSRRVSLASTPA